MKLTTSLKWSRITGISIVTCFISLSFSTVHAADRLWDAGGGIDTDFGNAANWSDDTLPVAGDNALANGTITITSDVGSSGSRLGVLELGRWFGTGTLTQTAGTVYTAGFNVGFVGTGTYNLNGSGSIDMTNDFLLGHSGGGTDAGTGAFNMNTSGTFTTNYVKIADSSWGSNMTSGTFTLAAGTVNSTWGARVGGGASNNAGLGTMNLSGGTFNSGGNFVIGDGGAGANGAFNMTGGTLNVTGANGTEFWVGNGHAGDYSTVGNGTANVSSGTLNVGSWLVVGRDGGVGTLTISGDAVVNQGTTYANAMLELGNFGGNNNSTLNLNGGTLATNGIYDNGGAGNSTTFNFDGGTLKARKDNGDFLNADTVNVKDGGAVIDSNGFNITIDSVFAANGTGGLTKNGSGTLTMTADHTFAGQVVVNAGTLSVTNGNNAANNAFSYANGITVNNGGTLRARGNALFGWDGSQAKTITINGGTAIAENGDQNVGNIILNGGTLASVNHDAYWGSWHLGRNNAAKTLSVTENATASAEHVAFTNGADINVSSGKTLNFSGTIGDGGNDGSSSVIKNGDGTLALNGVNTYTGATLIIDGTVSVGASGSIDNTSGVSLGNGGTFDVSSKSGGYTINNLSGSGNVLGALTVSTTLAVGNSPGTATFGGDLTIDSGATSIFEFTNTAFSGSTFDLAQGGVGTQNVNFGGILNLLFSGGAYVDNSTVRIFNFETYSGNFSAVSFSGLDINQSAVFDSGTGFVTIVPEPGAALLGGIGMLALLRRRRG